MKILKELNRYVKLFVLVVSSLVTSCTGIKCQIKKNHIYTQTLAMDMVKETENVFCLSTPFSNVSYVWTYSRESVKIYKLISGKVANFTEHKDLSDKSWTKQVADQGVAAEVFNCAELDGDVLHVFVEHGSSMKEHRFPVDLDCLLEKTIQSVFLTSVAKDIRKYEIKL